MYFIFSTAHIRMKTRNILLHPDVGAVEGDLHGKGRNPVSIMQSCKGYKYLDVGVDEAARLAALRQTRPCVRIPTNSALSNRNGDHQKEIK